MLRGALGVILEERLVPIFAEARASMRVRRRVEGRFLLSGLSESNQFHMREFAGCMDADARRRKWRDRQNAKNASTAVKRLSILKSLPAGVSRTDSSRRRVNSPPPRE